MPHQNINYFNLIKHTAISFLKFITLPLRNILFIYFY